MVRVLTRQERRALERLERKAKKPRLPETKPSYWYWLIPCLAAFLIYARSLSFNFISADFEQIVTNKQIQSWSYLPRLLLTHLWSQNGTASMALYYRPVFSLWMITIHAITGLSPFGWHLSNVLLHVIATLMVFKFASELLDSQIAASTAAVLFAIHPIHIEDVCWASAANEMIYTVLVLCSFLCLLRGIRQPQSVRIWLSLAAWSAALFAKETAIAALPIFFLLALQGWPKRDLKTRLRTVLAYVAVAILYVLVRVAVLHKILGQDNHSGATWKEVLLTSPFAMMFYLRKLLIPIGLFPEYRTALQKAATLQVWLAATLILLGIALVTYLGRERREWLVGMALLCFPLLPVLAGIHFFHSFGPIEFEVVHDRYLYFPSVGFALIIGLLVKYLWVRSSSVGLVLGWLVIAVLICFNLVQQGYYRNEASLSLSRYRYRAANSIIGEDERLLEIGKLLAENAVGYCASGQWEGAHEALNLTGLPYPISKLNFHERDGALTIYQGSHGLATTSVPRDIAECLQLPQ